MVRACRKGSDFLLELSGDSGHQSVVGWAERWTRMRPKRVESGLPRKVLGVGLRGISHRVAQGIRAAQAEEAGHAGAGAARVGAQVRIGKKANEAAEGGHQVEGRSHRRVPYPGIELRWRDPRILDAVEQWDP